MELGEREGEKEGLMIEGQASRTGVEGEQEGRAAWLFEMYELKTYIKSHTMSF